MRHAHLSLVFAAMSAVGALAAAPAVQAGSSWDEIRPAVFGDRMIHRAGELVQLTAPFRPKDQSMVPVKVQAGFKDGRTIRAVTLIVDENPTPVAAVFDIGAERTELALAMLLRLNAGRLAGLKLLYQRILDNDLRITRKRMAAQKRRMADVLAVNLEAEPGREQHAQGCEHTQDACAVRESLKVDRQPNVVAVFRRDALNKRTYFVLGAWRWILAHDLPIAVLRFDGTFLCEHSGREAGKQEANHSQVRTNKSRGGA